MAAKEPEAARAVSSATLASGMSTLAVVSLLALLVSQAHAGLCVGADTEARPVCATPVEVAGDGRAHLTCAGEAELSSCGPLAAGDRVELTAGHCLVASGGMSGATRLLAGLPLNLNRASAHELALLDGVGPKIAEQIVADRALNGPFASVDALARVRGVGEKTVAMVRAYLVVGAP